MKCSGRGRFTQIRGIFGLFTRMLFMMGLGILTMNTGKSALGILQGWKVTRGFGMTASMMIIIIISLWSLMGKMGGARRRGITLNPPNLF